MNSGVARSPLRGLSSLVIGAELNRAPLGRKPFTPSNATMKTLKITRKVINNVFGDVELRVSVDNTELVFLDIEYERSDASAVSKLLLALQAAGAVKLLENSE